jgi:uncharacterized membrane protein
MDHRAEDTVVCQICGQKKARREVWPGELVQGAVLETIRKKHPLCCREGFICLTDLNHFRTAYVQQVLEESAGELATLRSEAAKSTEEFELLSKNINVEFEKELTFWERMSDRVAEFGGSWAFLLSFFAVVAVWVVINAGLALFRPFDPYPFIFLNLVLSGLAGVQAPIILMSQNRQDAKDRLRSEHDYRLSLKSELEIRHLHEKLDLLLTHQWRELLEIQRLQLEVLEEMAGELPRNRQG